MKRTFISCLIGIAIGVGVVAIVIADFNTKQIKKTIYVIPDGFHGVAIIKMNTSDGIALPVVEGTEIIRFPINGILEIKGEDPMKSYSEKIAQWSSGKPLNFLENESSDLNARLSHLGYFHHQRESWYYVGTRSEAEAFFVSVEGQMN